jgi:hypothetical protein
MSQAATFSRRSSTMSITTTQDPITNRGMGVGDAHTIEIDCHGDVLLQFAAEEEHTPSLNMTPSNDFVHVEMANAETSPSGALVRASCSSSPKPINLRVSSAVLSLISPFFSRVFSSTGNFGEAIAFRAPGSPRPFPLPLPEDNPDAFTLLAFVVHHRADAIPTRPSTDRLVDLAVLADKYECAPALRPYGTLWLQQWLDTSDRDTAFESLEPLCQMLLFAYVLDLPEQFAPVSWQILLQHRQGFKDEMGAGFELPISKDHVLLRHDIHGMPRFHILSASLPVK